MTFPKYDEARFHALRESAVFNAEYYRGHIQDQSKTALAMSYAGAPRFTRIGNVQGLAQNGINQGTRSGAVSALLDVTGNIWFEALLRPDMYGTDRNTIWDQSTVGAGGCRLFWHSLVGSSYVRLDLFTAAGAVARTINASVGSFPVCAMRHCVVASSGGGTGGAIWIDGIPAATTLAGAGVASNPVAASVIEAAGSGGYSRGTKTTVLVRVWQGTPTNEDAATLYAAARSLVSG